MSVLTISDVLRKSEEGADNEKGCCCRIDCMELDDEKELEHLVDLKL